MGISFSQLKVNMSMEVCFMSKYSRLTVYIMVFLILFSFIGLTQVDPNENNDAKEKKVNNFEKESYQEFSLIRDQKIGILDCKDVLCHYPD